MRASVCSSLLLVAPLLVACGGNVVVDGAGASGTSSTSSTSVASSTSGTGAAGGSTTTTGTSSSGATCSNLSGEGLTGGGCISDATCNGNAVTIQCTPDATSATCQCMSGGATVGSCQEASISGPKLCNPISGCCAQFF